MNSHHLHAGCSIHMELLRLISNGSFLPDLKWEEDCYPAAKRYRILPKNSKHVTVKVERSEDDETEFIPYQGRFSCS